MTKGGEVRKGAGQTVTLRPATNYAAQLNTYYGGKSLGYLPPDAANFDKTTVSDADGKFEFKNVPAGDYFVSANVSWSVFYPGTFAPIESKQGGIIIKRITIEDGAAVETMLTR